ncbi:MAG TPA: peptidoglycan DD-metalloendopeptidase family protein [Stellaceae bacterium]|jgi:murein DD-endopeptidase MepM/ murein hydrolase activator NlpD|nr:peptidoglycan DD-metalloendopeptidase family protein [Stellaceae bacterium]
MVADLLRWGTRVVPDSRSLFEQARTAVESVSSRPRLAAGAAAALGLAVLGAATVSVVRHEHIASADRASALRVEAANAALQGELDRLRDRLGADRQALSSAQSRLSALAEEANSKQQQLAATEQASSNTTDRVGQLTRELRLAEAQRATLLARLSKAEADIADEHARRSNAATSLDDTQRKLQQLSAERDRAISERDHLKARVAELEHRVSSAQPIPPAKPLAAAQAPAALAEGTPVAAPPARQALAVMPDSAPGAAEATPQPQPVVASAPASHVAVGGLAQLERVLGTAGVDVAHLFSQYGLRTGEGGPFVPVGRGPHPDANTLSPEKIAALRNLVKSLPVSAPLESYDVGSPFGVRGDPINGHSSFHTGIDLLAPYMTPVYATAGGTVIYSGYRDDYGKVVEIDHGHGLTTRYAHLHRQTVSVGQQVAAHTQIGFLGSTGRATGPHVHYEVLVNGEPQDPAKFMNLARVVTVAAR